MPSRPLSPDTAFSDRSSSVVSLDQRGDGISLAGRLRSGDADALSRDPNPAAGAGQDLALHKDGERTE